jgi:hypothetical protein
MRLIPRLLRMSTKLADGTRLNPTLLLLAALWTATSFADDAVDHQKVSGTAVILERNITVKPRKDPVYVEGRSLLAQFSVTPSAGSSPPSFIVAGRVVDDSGGMARGMVSIFFGSPLHPPRLAGLTDVDGKFRFRISLKGDQRESRLQTPTLDEGVLYLGSTIGEFGGGIGGLLLPRSDDFCAMRGHAYSFRELLAFAAAKTKTAPAK